MSAEIVTNRVISHGGYGIPTRVWSRALPWSIRWSIVTIVATILLAGAALTIAASRAGLLLVVDNPTPSDVIVVLGGDDGVRLPEAVRLLKSGYGKQVIVDTDSQYHWLGRTEAQRTAAQVASMRDVAAQMSVCPMEARSTLAEAKDFANCIHGLEVHRIILVTSPYHSRRALATFRHALPQYEWSVDSAEDGEVFGTAWWQKSVWVATTVHEWEKLLWWETVEKWTA